MLGATLRKPSVPIFQSQVEGIPIGQKVNLPIRGLEKTTDKISLSLNFIMPAFDLCRPVFFGPMARRAVRDRAKLTKFERSCISFQLLRDQSAVTN